MHLLPSLFFDTKRVRKVRETVQKPWSKEEIWAFYALRPFSIYVSDIIVRKTALTPNALTISGILFGLASTGFYMSGTHVGIFLGFLFYQLCYFFDCVDGEVARMRQLTSKGGMWLDIGLNYSQALSTFGVVYGLFRSFSPVVTPLLLFVTLSSILTNILASEGAISVFGNSASDATFAMRKRTKVIDITVFLLFTETGFQFGLFLTALIWSMAGLDVFILGWTLFHILTLVGKSIFKIRLNMKNM